MRLLGFFLLLRIATAQTPTDFEGWVKLGLRENGYGNYRRAAIAFERAVSADPSSARAHFLLAEALATQFRPGADEPYNVHLEELAVQHFRRVLELDPSNARAMMWLGSFSRHRNDSDIAQSWFEKATVADPGSKIAWASLSQVLYSKSHLARYKMRAAFGLEYREGAIADGEARAKLRNEIGPNLDLAVAAAERAVSLAPEDISAASLLASALRYRADTRESIEEVEADLTAAKQWMTKYEALKEDEEKRRIAAAATLPSAPPIHYVQVPPEVAERRKIFDAAPVVNAGDAGTVRMRIWVNREGRITDMRCLSGPASLCNAAMTAVNRWEYQPTLDSDKAAGWETEVSVTFNSR